MSSQTSLPLQRVVAHFLAGFVPACLYIATSSGYAYWFDSGEFVAVAADFGISHPPGHPLSAIVFGASRMLPLGSLAFRAALVSAICCSIAAVMLYRATSLVLARFDRLSALAVDALSVAAAWWAGGALAWWFQSVRPEVYALQTALMMFVCERLLFVLVSESDFAAKRAWYVACFFWGLSLSNHHFLGLTLLPGGAYCAYFFWKKEQARTILRGAGWCCAALTTYLFLIVRAAGKPFLDLGDPSSIGRLWWVVSAQAFQHNQGTEVPQSFVERFADVIVVLGEDLHYYGLFAAAFGLYVLFRIQATRRIALLLGILLAFAIFARAWLGFVRNNPDAAGYLMTATGLVTLCATVGIASLLAALSASQGIRRKVATVFALLLVALSPWQIASHLKKASLQNFADTDTLDETYYRQLAPQSVILAHNPQTMFRIWHVAAEESSRPDLVLVPMPFLTYPNMVSTLVAQTTDLRPLFRDYFLKGRLREEALESLAAIRPVYVELDPRVSPNLYRTLKPALLFHRVVADGTTAADERDGAEQQFLAYRWLTSILPFPLEENTERQILWQQYMNALYFANFGDIAHARHVVSQGLVLNPHSQELRALNAALQDAPLNKPLNIQPFLLNKREN